MSTVAETDDGGLTRVCLVDDESVESVARLVKVGNVSVFTKILDGGWFARCAACWHPARVTPRNGEEPYATCAACGRSLFNAPETTHATYRASRDDNASIPFVTNLDDCPEGCTGKQRHDGPHDVPAVAANEDV